MSTPTELAEQLMARAERDDAAAFDAQYELARRGERVVAALAADGAARARQWAEDDRRGERHAERRDDEADDDEVPTRWLH